MARFLMRLTRRNAFPLLMVLSLVLVLAPRGWFSWIRGFTQPLAWLQSGASSVTHAVQDGAQANAERLSPEEARMLRNEHERLMRQVTHLEAEISGLRRRLEETTRLRAELAGSSARLIVADVIGGDTSPRRAALFLRSTRKQGVQPGDWVAAGTPLDDDAEYTGRERLMRQWLIGRVDRVDPLNTRVTLATDPSFGPVRAWVSRRLEDGARQFADRECLLYGAGNGKMIIRESTQNYLEEGYETVHIAIGDTSPTPIAIGRIVAAQRLNQSALHYNLDVSPSGDIRNVRQVYVISDDEP